MLKTPRLQVRLSSLAIPGLLLFLPLCPLRADDKGDAMLKAASMDAGKMSPTEQNLFQQSIRGTKDSISRETLEVFYKDAVDYYHEHRYDESLELLDKIYSIDPAFEDVQSLRETVQRLKSNQSLASTRPILEDYMRKGNQAFSNGQNVVAISLWKQALTVNPAYEPAKKRIQEVNHALAQKQYETGYLYYNHGDMEDALDSWSNAIALDPSYKQRGLLLLMSKVELNVRRDQMSRLSAQGFDQYQRGDLDGALQTFTDLSNLDPRNEDSRRMIAKIKIQLGQTAFKAGRDAMARHYYPEAIKQFEASIAQGFEVQRSQKAIQDVEKLMQVQKEPPHQKPKPVAATPAQPTQPVPPPKPAQPANPEEALRHYREGLGAIRTKDYHRAVEELEIASQLDPTDERIYIAKERAKQEWTAANGQHP